MKITVKIFALLALVGIMTVGCSKEEPKSTAITFDTQQINLTKIDVEAIRYQRVGAWYSNHPDTTNDEPVLDSLRITLLDGSQMYVFVEA